MTYFADFSRPFNIYRHFLAFLIGSCGYLFSIIIYTATSVDDDLRVLVRKLRVGQDELRDGQEKLRVGQEKLRVGQDEVRGGQSRHEELIESLLKKGGDHQV